MVQLSHELIRERDAAQERLTQSESDQEKLRQDLERTGGEKNVMTKEMTAMVHHRNMLEEEHDTLKLKLGQLRVEKERSDEQRTMLERKVRDFKQKKKKGMDEDTELSKVLDEARRLEMVNVDITRSKQTFQRLCKDYEEKLNDSEDIRQEKEAMLKNIRQTVEELSEQLAQKITDQASKSSKLEEAQQEVRALQAEKEQFEKERIALKAANERATRLEDANRYLTETLSSETRIKMDLMRECGNARREIESLRSDMEQQRKQGDDSYHLAAHWGFEDEEEDAVK